MCDHTDGAACAEIEGGTRLDTAVVPREGRAVVTVYTLPPQVTLERVPRHLYLDRSNLLLHVPGQRLTESAALIDDDDWAAWREGFGADVTDTSQIPDLAAPFVQELTVPLCRTHVNEDGTRDLVFDPSSSWTFRLCNLSSAQPGWRDIIERTLMFFPIDHVERTNLRHLYFDFRVGTRHQGPGEVRDGHRRAPRGGRRVSSGGTNHFDRERGSTLCVTFAALNLWGRRASRPGSDAEMDDWFSLANYAPSGAPPEGGQIPSSAATDRVIGTFYHEHGHIYRPERGLHLNRNQAPWPQYFMLMLEEYGGLTQGPGEAFSEAYRYRLTGKPCISGTFSAADKARMTSEMETQLAGKRAQKAQAEADRTAAVPRSRAWSRADNLVRQLDRDIRSLETKVDLVRGTDPVDGDVGALADAALDALGIPRLASVAKARADIVRYLASRGGGGSGGGSGAEGASAGEGAGGTAG